MPAPFLRSALVVAVPVGAVLAVVGALALGVPGLVSVLVVAAVVGVTSAGVVREAGGAQRGTAVDAGPRAAGWTAGVLLVLAGTAALAGGLVAVLTGAVVGAVVLAVRLHRAEDPPHAATRPRPVSARPTPARRPAPAGSALLVPPVGGLSTPALGEEWVRSTALLDARLDPVVRRAVVARREELLDELERRDPAGVARWLAGGPEAASDPAEHVRDHPAAGTEAA